MRIQTHPYIWSAHILFSFFFSYGVFMAFWPVWLKAQGISVEIVGLMLGLGSILRGIVNLVVTPKLSRVFFYLSLLLAAAIILTSLNLTSQYMPYLFALVMMMNFVFAPIIPLIDALCTQMSRLKYIDYGKVRIWGTIGFIAGVLAIGQLIGDFGTLIGDYGINFIPYTLLLMLLVTLIWSYTRPKVSQLESLSFDSTSVKDLIDIMKDSYTFRVLLLVSLIQGSHGVYYVFSAIWWHKVGFSSEMTSYFWAFSMFVEIFIFAFLQNAFWRLSNQHLFYIIGLAAVVRWTLTALTQEAALIFFAQALHGITFAVTHLVIVRFIQQTDAKRAVQLQGAYNGLAMCLSLGIISMISGPLFGYFEGYTFLFMALFVLPVFLIKVEANQTWKMLFAKCAR